MELTISPKDILQIDDAIIKFRNFSGKESKYNRKGDRNFVLVIPTEEMAEALRNNVNKYGVGWSVVRKVINDDGDEEFRLKVKVKFNEYGPDVFLISGKNKIKLDEDSVGELDYIDIKRIDMDIRPYDDEFGDKVFRAAYLQKIYVTQELDRFAARYAEEEYPE